MVVQRKLFTVDEFLRLAEQSENAERHLELINGEIVEVSPKLKHGLRGSVLHGEIYAYLKTNPIGRVTFEVDHFLPNDPGNTRRPDVSFITNQRLERLTNEDAVPFMPDLAIEVKSPANYYTGKAGLRGKAQYYLAHGSRLVWLVDPDRYTIEVYAPGQSVRTLSMADTLSGGDVLPGFLPVRAIFS
ncbi:MAG: Uma2 family endonuclease [Chloroflexi bacterium]|nr:Uma2 family endonuclease [Chloroflexota bacterium]